VTPLGRVLLIARSQIGVTECPPNTNKGLKVSEYLRSCHLGEGHPWCAAFVRWVGRFALGEEWPIPAMAGCASLGEWAQKRGMLREGPEPGDVFLLYYPSLRRFAHTGFVVSPANGGWVTIEGNTSGAGSREGWGVFQKQRTFGPEDRFIRWHQGL